MLSDANIRKIGRILGLEKSGLAKKAFGKYQKFKFRNYHGIIEKEIQGSRMFLDLDDPTTSMNLFFYGVQSTAITSCFYNEIKTGMTVLDIGANIGCYTFLATKLCDPTGKVFAFEPSKTSCDLIQKSLNVNLYSNVKLIPKAVSNETKKGKLFINPRTSADNGIIESSENRESADIEMVSLDDFISENNIQPDFIKIDVQGAEFYVIEGMKDLLESSIPIKLIIEFSPLKDHKRKSQFDSCLKKMKELGFSIFRLKEVNDISNLKSNKFYISQIKSAIENIKETGISKFDEADLLFIRE